MNNKIKNIVVTCALGIVFFAIAFACFFKAPDDFTNSERRKLAQFPIITKDTILSGKAMSDFESYTLDQFPMRDTFRTAKVLISRYAFMQKENNGLYCVNEHIASLDYPFDEASALRATKKFEYILSKYANDSNRAYISLIPDKNYFLASSNGYPSINYDNLVSTVKTNCPSMEYIDIFPTLTIDDYYRTDTHWKQENLLDTAAVLANKIGIKIPTTENEYEKHTLDIEFSGVYAGQMMLPTKKDRISYFTNDTIDSLFVRDLENDMPAAVYTLEKADGADPYEIFLKGPISLMKICNPKLEGEGSRLIIFRDSFTSSLAPLLAQGCEEIMLIDIRYISSEILGSFVDFTNADILFLYSTAVINNSITLK